MGRIKPYVSKKGKRTFHASVTLKGAPNQHASFDKKSDAKKWIQDVEYDIRHGRYFKYMEATKHTLNDLIERYIQQGMSKHPKRIKDQIWIFEYWSKRIGEKLLSEITPSLISEIRDELLKEKTSRKKLRTPSTVNRYLAALSSLFTAAQNDFFWIEDHPVRRVKKPKENKANTRYLSKEEVNRLLLACKKSKSKYLYTLVVLALSTGCRHGELINLKWGDIDFFRKCVTLLNTKNGDTRIVPLTKFCIKELQDFKGEKTHSPFDLIFKSDHSLSKTGKVYSRNSFLKAMKEAGIENATFHCLRHTCASYLAMNGNTPLQISEILGHKTLNMVKRYAHLNNEHIANILESSTQTYLSNL